MTDLPIRKVLQKPDMAGRMVSWAVELFEIEVQYELRGPIKGQVYVDFLVEFSSPYIDRRETSSGSSPWTDPPTNKEVGLVSS